MPFREAMRAALATQLRTDVQRLTQLVATEQARLFPFAGEFAQLDVLVPPSAGPVTALSDATRDDQDRYKNVGTYEHSRVVLKPLPGDVPLDYVNASWVPGSRAAHEYISAQAPMHSSRAQFW